MVATVAAGTSARYYTQQSEYYLGGREPAGNWLRAGPGLGVAPASEVVPRDFERLHAALDGQGRTLLANAGSRTDRVAGYDITFSAPKSVSILWGLGGDGLRTAVERAQEQAVAAAVELLDGSAAFCRRGKGGRDQEAVRLTVALFRHGEARPAEHEDGLVFGDIALHHHACTLSVAQRADGTFGAIDGRQLFAWKMAAGAVYHAELARGLQQLGFAVEHPGPNGLFEVAGVDPALCGYFSARRGEIERELDALGVAHSSDAPALAAAKARATRKAKSSDHAGDEERHAFWRTRAEARGFAPERVVEEARTRGREQALARTPQADEALIRERLAAVPRGLTETGSLFGRRHLVAAVASALVGTGAGAERATAEVERLVAEGHVVALGRDGRSPHPIYSTPEVIRIEHELQAIAGRLAAVRLANIPEQSRLDHLADQAGLNPEQAQAARRAVDAPALGIVEGAPGVGKTTLLKPVVQAWREEGWRVIGAATAWKTANALRDDLDIEARAIDSWIAGAEHGRPFLADRTLLVVDEAALVSSRQLHRVLSEVDAARRAGLKVGVRLLGDRKQIQSVGGPGFRIVADEVGTQRVDTIVRQRAAWARETVMCFGEGRAEEALAAFDAHAALHPCSSSGATVTSMVAAWSEARSQHPDQPEPLLIAKSNRQVLALNDGVRRQLRQNGQLGAKDEAVLRAVTASGREHRLALTVGDRIRFLTRSDEVGVFNGTEATLTRVEVPDPAVPGSRLFLTARVGADMVRFAPEDLADTRGRVRLGHAYASTCYGAQGLTTETALVWVDPGMDRHDIHVAASRARDTTRLFVDDASLDARVRSDRPLSERGRPVRAEERRVALARALSRSGEKASTLDYTVQVQPTPDRFTELVQDVLTPLPKKRSRGRSKGHDREV
jgi:conjugative relaxase-like TrwC/TraI family protein